MAFPHIIESMESHWWVFLLRGILAVLFGIFVLASPGAGLATLVLIFGCYAIADGIAALILGVPRNWGFMLVGVLSILVGIAAFARPMLTATTLIYALAIWGIFIGVGHLVSAFFGREGQGADWWNAIAGVAAIVLGGLILANPAWGLVTVVAAIGIYALISGVSFMILAFRLNGARRHHARLVPT